MSRDEQVAASTEREPELRYEEALRAILAVRLDEDPELEPEDVFTKARYEMRQIAEEALRDA